MSACFPCYAAFGSWNIWELEPSSLHKKVQQFGLAIFQFAWYLQTIVGFWFLVDVCQLWVVGPVACCFLLLGPTPRGRHILASAQGGGWGGVITLMTTLRLLATRVHVTCCRCCRSWANSSKRRTAAEERQSRAKENMIALKADVDTLQSFV